MEKDDEKQEDCIDYDGKAARFTLAMVLAALLIWFIYDWVKVGKTSGILQVLICSTGITFSVTKSYLMKRDTKRKKKSELKKD
ncbi:hypothetical protein ACIQ2D_10875 [Lysinibacillus sp. NPDC097287]|uniref:hypothetical protein n=1 Tax=Lysinibacillus sp. NPDC097287 TaxID=3364144 RepID=UPI0038120324